VFLEVYYTVKARDFFPDVLKWFADQEVHRDLWFEADFIRARIDRMLVDFWSDVRASADVSSKFGQFSFSVDGDVWRLLAAYEADMLRRLRVDPFPHTRFFHADGEFMKISRAAIAPQSTPVPKSSVTSTVGASPSKPVQCPICPYHLFVLLRLKRHDGSDYDPCHHGSKCVNPHCDLSAVTADEALESVKLSGINALLISKVHQQILSQPGAFKP
jgi:hypothetical protein